MITNNLQNPIKVTRDEVNMACSRILPQHAFLVPKHINEISFWEMCAKHCFVNNLQNDDVETLRAGLNILKTNGRIE